MKWLKKFNDSNPDEFEKIEDLFLPLMDKWSLDDRNQADSVSGKRFLIKMNSSSFTNTDQLAWSIYKTPIRPFPCDDKSVSINIYYHKDYDHTELWNDFKDFYKRLKKINYNPIELKESCPCYFLI